VRAFLRDSLPALATAPIRAARVCLYCDTFDGDFWIDHDPDRPGLVVAAGDSGHGFKFAPILGPLIADVVEHRRNRWASRFRWRSRREDRREAARAEA
jgi:glycine/D-amino acid oxidase-like deaminating enzyme